MRRPDDVFEPRRPSFQRGRCARYQHPLERRHASIVARYPLMSFVIDDQDLRTRIAQAVIELAAGPPGVERNDDRADRDTGKERDGPLGQIAHRQRNAVALSHPHRAQRRRQRRDGAVMRLVRHALVVVDREFARAVRSC